MPVNEQRVAGPQHEERRVHVQHPFAEKDEADAIDVAQDHDGELQQHHEEGEPPHDGAHRPVDLIEPVGNAVWHALHLLQGLVGCPRRQEPARACRQSGSADRQTQYL